MIIISIIIIIIIIVVISIIMQQAQCLAVDTLKLASIKKCRLPLSPETVSVSPWATVQRSWRGTNHQQTQQWTVKIERSYGFVAILVKSLSVVNIFELPRALCILEQL